MSARSHGRRRALLLAAAVAFVAIAFVVGPRWSARAPERGVAPRAPQRIVALGHTGVYETLLDFGVEDRIVAVTVLNEYPGSEGKLRLQTAADGAPNVEAVLALAPDLVVVKDTVAPSIERVGIRVVGVPAEGMLARLDAFVLELGDALAAPERARELVDRMHAGRDRIARLTAGMPRVRVYYEHPGPYVTYGRPTFAREVIQLCGGVIVTGEIEQPRPTVNAEFVIAADPEVIVLGAFTESPEEVARRPGWSSISAIRNGRVFQFAPDDRMLWSTRFPERAERLLLSRLHPDAAK